MPAVLHELDNRKARLTAFGPNRMSVGPVYQRQDGRVVKARVMAMATGSVAARPLWEGEA